VLPITPGVPAPRSRFPGGAPKRTCGKCGGIAKALRITRHTHKGMPTGTDSEYVCGQCGLEFTTENVLGHAFSTAGGAMLGAVSAAFFFSARSAGWKWGGSIVMALFAALLLGQAVVRIANRFKHKEREENVL
jgi:ribosomal protein S27AE